MLTGKREAFAQAVASGMTQADGYRKAFDSKKMTAKTISEEASRLMADRNVSARVTELKSKLAEKAMWTREMSVEALKKITVGSDKGTEVVAAVKELNAMHGYNAPSKVELSGEQSFTIIERRIVKANDTNA